MINPTSSRNHALRTTGYVPGGVSSGQRSRLPARAGGHHADRRRVRNLGPALLPAMVARQEAGPLTSKGKDRWMTKEDRDHLQGIIYSLMDRGKRGKVLNICYGLTAWTVLIFGIVMCFRWIYKPPSSKQITISKKPWDEENSLTAATRADRKRIANEGKVVGTSHSPAVVRLFPLNVDEFVHRYNLALKAYNRPDEVYKLPHPPGRDVVNLRVMVNGRTSAHLTINLFIDHLTQKIRKVEGAFSGDGTEKSGVDVFFRLIASILAIEDVILSHNKDKMYGPEHERAISQAGLLDPGVLEIEGKTIKRTLKGGVYEITPPSIKKGTPTILVVNPR